MKYHSRLAGLLILATIAPGASAYQWLGIGCGPISFNNGHTTMNYGANLFGKEKAALDIALARTTAFSDTSITISDRNDTNYGLNNYDSEIFYYAAHPTAACYLSVSAIGCLIDEADIVFGDLTWYTAEDSGHRPYTGNTPRSIIGTGIHEAGHCLGMGHENTMYNIMGQDWDHVTRNGTTTYYGPGEDLSNGLIFYYGKRSGGTDTVRDVGATVFRYEAAHGEYSGHKWGLLRYTSGLELPVVGSFSGQNRYKVLPGQAIEFEVTLENNGEKDTETPNVGWYLSTNSIISANDTLIGTSSVTLNRNTPYEWTPTVTIPADTAGGDYFLGLYVDHDSLIPENTADNNVAYYPVRVMAPDLVTESVSVSDASLYALESFSISATVRNQGDLDSGDTTLRYYRSSNSTISTADTEIGTDFVIHLSPNASSPESITLLAPLEDETFWLGACVDAVASESVTDNQCTAGVQVTVSTPPPTVTTGAVTDLAATTARLHATANPNGVPTTIYFDYAELGGELLTVNGGSIGEGTAPIPLSLPISGLTCETSYLARARAISAGGETEGSFVGFRTANCPGC